MLPYPSVWYVDCGQEKRSFQTFWVFCQASISSWELEENALVSVFAALVLLMAHSTERCGACGREWVGVLSL